LDELTRIGGIGMNHRAEELHRQAIVVDGHNHIMTELGQRRNRGDRAVFSNYYGPMIRDAGVNVIMLVVGGDNTCLANDSDLMLWGSLWVLDMLWEEAEESKDTIAICVSFKEVEAALANGKIAIILTMEGGRALEGKPNYETLVGLRSFYRQGLRGIQLVDNGRNRLGDGKGEARTRGGLTNFGVSVVQEANRLGMLVDVAHLTEPGFWDVIETSKDPIIDSHSNARAVCSHPRNLTDDQIKAIAKGGGVIGLSTNASMTSNEIDKPTVDDLIKHADHIAGLVGIDHVGLGPDHLEFELKVNLWAPAPGWLEGVYYGTKDTYYIQNLKNVKGFPLFTETLVNRGYSDEDIKKILGGNWLRVYKRVIG
jgi:membrane dipeptidase